VAELPRSSKWAHRLRDWWIEWIIEHRIAVLVAGALVTVVSVWLAAQLEVDTDLRTLLPSEHPVVEALGHIEENYGAVGSINVVVQGGSPEARHALADAFAEQLADEPMLREVDHRIKADFFLEHALYYIDDADMAALTEHVQAWQHYVFCSAAPDVCIDEPDAGAPAALQAFIDDKREAIAARSTFTEYYEREGIDALVVFLRPTESSADLDFTVAVSERMRERVDAIFASPGAWSDQDMRVNLVGPYIGKAAEREVIERDMLRAALFALGGVTVVLLLLFRSIRAVLTLLIPLACGVAWSLGLAQLVVGHLNAITSLISSVVMGIGIDAGLHFLTRARREREVHGSEESIRRAFKSVIAPLLIASGTTVSAFVVMATSQFPAFGEFGIIAALGVGLCLLAMLTVFPALLAVIGVKKAKRLPPGGVSQATHLLLARPGLVFVAMVILTVASVRGVAHMRSDGFERNSRNLQSRQARATTEADVFLISEILGRDVHASVLSVDSWETLERVYARAEELHTRRAQAGSSLVAGLSAAPGVMPPPDIDLEARGREIKALTTDWSPRTWARLRGEDPGEAEVDAGPGFEAFDGGDEWGEFEPYEGDTDKPEPLSDPTPSDSAPPDSAPPEPAPPEPDPKLDPAPTKLDAALGNPEDGALLEAMLKAEPFGPDDLPPQAIGALRGSDGSWGIFAYPNYDAADIYLGVEFMAELSDYSDDTGLFVGEPTIYATIFLTLKEEWPVVFGMAALIITAFVFWQVRGVVPMLITLSPLLLATWWTFGILGAFDLKLSLFNAPILPAILGIGVDNGVYLTAAIRGETSTKTGLYRSVDETGRAILAATMTTTVGFGAFLVADSGGLRSIGYLAVIGISTTAIAAMLAVPTISALIQRRRDRLDEL